MRRALVVTAAVLAPLISPFSKAQDLPLARQYFSVAPSVLASATQVSAAPVSGASGSVLVIFRRGADGRIIDASATGGSQDMQESALTSIRQWHFKPALFNGFPAQLVDAATFAFSKGAVTVEPAPMMSTKQLSPTLGFPCPNAYAHHDAAAVELCKQQLHDVQQALASTDVERLIAHDEYGLALLDDHQPKPALAEFSEAIRLATQVLHPTDPEVAYLSLHRLAAETLLSGPSAAEQDLTRARASLDALIENSSGAQRAYYLHLEQQFLFQSSSSPAPQ
ncbi:MAG: energy transducer TonB [Janthinobacterium lividum]